jgi:hypothetical protein
MSLSTPGRRMESSTVVPLGPRTRFTTSSVCQPLVSSHTISFGVLPGAGCPTRAEHVVPADAGTIRGRSLEQLGHRNLASSETIVMPMPG